jgi:hypothetical protein
MTLAIGRVVGGRLPGTAFAVSPEWAVTALHVLVDRKSRAAPAVGQVELVFPTGTVEADVHRDADLQLDVALLRLNGLPTGCEPVLLRDDAIRGMRWWARGFPAREPEYSIHGNVTDVDIAILHTRAPGIQLWCAEASAAQPRLLHGYSGAPVLGLHDDVAFGVIRAQPTAGGGRADLTASRTATGATIYCTPIAALKYRWPRILGPLVTPRSEDGRVRRLRTLLLTAPAPGHLVPRAAEVARLLAGVHDDPVTQARSDWHGLRQVDVDLRVLIGQAKVVVVAGPPCSGKTSAAFEALRVTVPDHGLAIPRNGVDLHELLDIDAAEPIFDGPLVLFLDGIQRYLEDRPTLDMAIVETMHQRPGGGALVATADMEVLDTLRGDDGERGVIIRTLLAGAECVDVPPRDPDREDDLWLAHRANGGNKPAAECLWRRYLRQNYKTRRHPDTTRRAVEQAASFGEPAAVVWLARDLFNDGDYRAARAALDPHVGPSRPDLLIELIRLLDKTPGADPAEVDTLVGQLVADGWSRLMMSVAERYQSLDRPDGQRRWFERAAAVPGASGDVVRFRMAVEYGNDELRLRTALAAARAGNADAMMLLGETAARVGRRDDAEDWYRRALAAGHRSALNALKDFVRPDVERLIEDAATETRHWLRIKNRLSQEKTR